MRTVDPVKHEEKRQAILAAASRCFARDGFRGGSISTICAEAGISPGHLYHYFESKEAIIRAMAEAYMGGAIDHFTGLAPEPKAIASVLAGVVSDTLRRDDPGQPLLLELVAEAARNSELAQVMQDHSRALRGLIGDLLSVGQAAGRIDPQLDPDIGASILLSLIDGLRALTIRSPHTDLDDSRAVVDTLVKRFLTGHTNCQSDVLR